MDVERNETGPVTVLRLDGDMDEAGVESLRTALYECATQGRFRVVLNLRDVGFMSYMSVGVLVERLRKFRGFGGDIKLVGLNLYTERLFRMVGITGLFERFDNEAQAAGTFQEAA